MKIKYKEKFSIPLWVYSIIFLIMVVLLMIPIVFSISDLVENILIGVACSLIASLITSILIDYSNTKSLNEKINQQDELEYNMLVNSVKNSCVSVIEYISHVCTPKAKILEKHTFVEWVDLMFDFDKELSKTDCIEIINSYIQVIEVLISHNNDLENELKYFSKNTKFDNDFYHNFGFMKLCLSRVPQNFRLKDYDLCKKDIIRFYGYAKNLFPELEKYDKGYDSLTLSFNHIMESVGCK